MGKVVYKKPRLALKEKAKRSTKLILPKQKPTGVAPRVAQQLDMYRTNQDLDFKGVDTQYGTHVIHTYVAAMVPQLAEALITTYVPRGEKVLDPFCGGGAVLIECVRNHRLASGSDINPLALLIAKVKSTYVDRAKLSEAIHYVQIASIKNLNGSLTFPDNYNLDYWFLPTTVAELTSIIRVIKECELTHRFSSDVLDVLKVAFSGSVRDVMLTYRNEVRLRRMEPDDLRQFHPKAFDSFASRSKLAIDRIPNLPKSAHPKVIESPVQNLPFEDEEFHSIICSPPYGDERNGVSYLQFSKYMLYWLGFSREEVIMSRKKTLGSSSVTIELPSTTLERAAKAIDRKDKDDNWLNFYREYYQGLAQMARVTRKYVIIVIGNRVLKQTIIENGKVTVELMDSLGVKLFKHLQRTLPSKRLPKLRREDNHGYGGTINKEDILIFTRK